MVHHHDHDPNITNYSKHHNDDDNDSQGKLVDRRDDNNPPIRSESNTSKSEKHLKSKQVNLHPNHPSAAKYGKVQQQQQQQKQSKDKASLKPKQVIAAKEATKPTESNKGFDLKEFRKQRDDERKQLRLTMQERRKMLQMNRASLMPLLEEDDDSLLEMDNQPKQLDLGEDEGEASSVDIHGEGEKTVANEKEQKQEEEEEDLIDLHEVLDDDDHDDDEDGTDIVSQSIYRQQQQQQRLLAQTFVLQVQQNGQQSLAMQEEQESLQEYDILIDQLQSILVTPTHTGLDDHAHGVDHRDGDRSELCKDDDDDRLLVEDSDEFEEESTPGDDDRLGMIDEEIGDGDGDNDEWDLEQCDATDDAVDKKSSDLPPQLYLYTADVRLLERMQPPSTSNHKQYDRSTTSNAVVSNNIRPASSIEMNQGRSEVDNVRSTASSKKLRAEEIEEYLCSRIGAPKLTQALRLLAETTTLSMKMSHNNNNSNMNIGGGSYDDKDEDLLNRIEGIIGNDCLHYLDDMLMLLTLKEHKLSS